MTTVLVPDPEPILQPYTQERAAALAGGAQFVIGAPSPNPDLDAEVLLSAVLPFPAEVLQGLTRCQLIVRYGIGYDTIDVDAARACGIVVANTPTYCVAEVADHAAGLILSLARHIPWLDQQVRAGAWSSSLAVISQMRRLSTRTLGIIGIGKIGSQVARRMAGFGMRILACDPYLSEATIQERGAAPVALQTLLEESDIVTLHVPLTSGTHHLIDAQALRRMKPSACLVNTCRGRVVDGGALIQALAADQIYGAALDVHEEEPLDPASPLLRLDPRRVIVTSHIAAGSADALVNQQEEVAATVTSFLAGEWPTATVNPGVVPKRPLRSA